MSNEQMNFDELYKDVKDAVIKKTTAEFARGAKAIALLDGANYSGVGPHFRHNLDFGNAFLTGVETGVIDYSHRQRDPRVETDATYAVEQSIFMVRRLAHLDPGILDTDVLVVSEIAAGCCHRSTVIRELEFLYSHALHHHALIAEKLRFAGIHVEADLGVAPSTLEFRRGRKAA